MSGSEVYRTLPGSDATLGGIIAIQTFKASVNALGTDIAARSAGISALPTEHQTPEAAAVTLWNHIANLSERNARQLLAIPTPAADTATAIAALQELFVRHGAPLVTKSDNGSAFR